VSNHYSGCVRRTQKASHFTATVAWEVYMKLWASLSLVLVLSTLTFGQDTGSITGTVRDSSGAVIPNAAVAVTNPATSVTRDLTSNSEGDYLAAGLPPGTYDVTVTAKGF